MGHSSIHCFLEGVSEFCVLQVLSDGRSAVLPACQRKMENTINIIIIQNFDCFFKRACKERMLSII